MPRLRNLTLVALLALLASACGQDGDSGVALCETYQRAMDAAPAGAVTGDFADQQHAYADLLEQAADEAPPAHEKYLRDVASFARSVGDDPTAEGSFERAAQLISRAGPFAAYMQSECGIDIFETSVSFDTSAGRDDSEPAGLSTEDVQRLESALEDFKAFLEANYDDTDWYRGYSYASSGAGASIGLIADAADTAAMQALCGQVVSDIGPLFDGFEIEISIDSWMEDLDAVDCPV